MIFTVAMGNSRNSQKESYFTYQRELVSKPKNFFFSSMHLFNLYMNKEHDDEYFSYQDANTTDR